jgi:hypothetical protein
MKISAGQNCEKEGPLVDKAKVGKLILKRIIKKKRC